MGISRNMQLVWALSMATDFTHMVDSYCPHDRNGGQQVTLIHGLVLSHQTVVKGLN